MCIRDRNMQSVDLHITLSHVPLSDEFVHAMQYAEGENSADTQDEYAGNQYLRLIDLAPVSYTHLIRASACTIPRRCSSCAPRWAT